MDKERFVQLAERPLSDKETFGELYNHIGSERDLRILCEMREALPRAEDDTVISLVLTTKMALAMRMAGLYADRIISASPDDIEDILKDIAVYFNDKLAAHELRRRLEKVTFEDKGKEAGRNFYLGILCAIEAGVDADELLTF